LIFADTDKQFLNITVHKNDGIVFPYFEIDDQSELSLDLLSDGQTVDRFYVHKDWMMEEDDLGESVQKLLLPNGPVITSAMYNDKVNLTGKKF
jgi:hypothetical protein